MNRWQMEAVRTGMAQELKTATEKLSAIYTDTTSTKAAREEQTGFVEDMKERLEGISAQIKAMDDEAEARMKTQRPDSTEGDVKTIAKAALYRAAMHNEPVAQEHRKALADDTSTGGSKFLPKTVSAEIITSPKVRNPLREYSTVTNILNLEIPKLSFTLENDSFIADGETAKEIAADGDVVSFERNKFKVFVDVSETVLRGSDANLVSYVDAGLESGLASKEKKVAFKQSPTVEKEKHMSFYNQSTAGVYDIKAVKAPTMYKAIKAAIGDLEEDFRDNAKIFMRYADYLETIETMANGSATLYTAQPEQVLGKPVVFCDLAVIPVVGDFSYSHYNYDLEMLYEHDKNIKSGMESFVLTAWMDHQIKLKAAFRLAVVDEGGSSQP